MTFPIYLDLGFCYMSSYKTRVERTLKWPQKWKRVSYSKRKVRARLDSSAHFRRRYFCAHRIFYLRVCARLKHTSNSIEYERSGGISFCVADSRRISDSTQVEHEPP